MTETATSPGRTRSRKVRAILAGGLVLGVGAAVTLAAWTDDEFVQGIFTAGQFDLEGSTTGADDDFASHPTAGAADQLEFTVDLAGDLAPGDVVYAPYFVRLAAGTTNDATLDLVALTSTATTTPDNTGALSWEVVALGAGASCDAAGIDGGTSLGSAATLASNPAVAGGTTPLVNGDPTSEAGATVPLCFEVTATDALAQQGSVTATWQLTATSTT